MMTSSRSQGEVAANFASRRGHSSQLSISDPTHHVTEAIGTLYGDEDGPGMEPSRPLSFVSGSLYQDQIHQTSQSHDEQFSQLKRLRSPNAHSLSDQSQISRDIKTDNDGFTDFHSPHRPEKGYGGSIQDPSSKSPLSPTPSLRGMQADSSGQKFSLTNIDNPSDIAQELSNLQALRRLSMDVGSAIDPDMPPMSSTAMPSVAPRGGDDENDPSRLLWVPARVHPELAPTEFKTFLESRLQSIRRRSGDSFLMAGSGSRANEPGLLHSSSLRRKKSMLSHQVDNPVERGTADIGDGVEQVERRRPKGSQNHQLSFDELVKNPTRAVQKLAQESHVLSTGDDNTERDIPILPIAPGAGLRRSTRTTYRKGGSLRSGDKISFSKRMTQRQHKAESADAIDSAIVTHPQGHSLTRIQSEPITENYSRPSNTVRRQQRFVQEPTDARDKPAYEVGEISSASLSPRVHQDEQPVQDFNQNDIDAVEALDRPSAVNTKSFPQRSSSQLMTGQSDPHSEVIEDISVPSQHRSSPSISEKQSTHPTYEIKAPNSVSLRTTNHILGSAQSPLPSGSASRTDTLTFIPTLDVQDERRVEKKTTKKDRDDEPQSSHKSSGAWKWFKGSTEDRERKKDDTKKSKSKALVDRTQDNARLDLIQTSIDKTAVKGRDSLVLDRVGVDNRLQEERRKESNRKSESRKEKDGSIFSSIFGGSKKKEEKERSKKSQHLLQVPDDPLRNRLLQPDIDYNWTRFPLLEERAIYRMAHIKLANPRRSLHSQVLLSNFMYSYLAIVQAMHPQMSVPISPQQRRLEEDARRKQHEQDYLAQKSMQDERDVQQNQEEDFNFDYHRMAVHYSESGTEGQVEYVDEAQIYEDEHSRDQTQRYNATGDYGDSVKEYFQYPSDMADQGRGGQNGLW